MILQYQSTIQDHVEPALRLFLRSKTYTKQRRNEAIWSGVIGSFVTVSMTYMFIDWPKLVAGLVGFVGGPIILLITYKDTISKRIAKAIAEEIGSRLPATSEYLIKDGRLIYKVFDVNISFNLQDLINITEDSERIEFDFGNKGISVIPIRAFEDADHKTSFLSYIEKEREQAAPSNR